MKLIALFVLLTQLSFAQTLVRDGNGDYLLKKSSYTVSEILLDYAKLENLNLMILTQVPPELVVSVGENKIKRENIRNFISVLLSQQDLTLAFSEHSNNVKVIDERDVRYNSAQSFEDVTKVPRDHFYYQYQSLLKHIDASEMARNLRPFMSRYGRVIDVPHADGLIIIDTGANIHMIAQMMEKLDTESFAKDQAEVKALNEKHQKIIKKEKAWTEILSNNTIIFILIFLLFGLVIGFGARGFMMKRIEGGW